MQYIGRDEGSYISARESVSWQLFISLIKEYSLRFSGDYHMVNVYSGFRKTVHIGKFDRYLCILESCYSFLVG